MGLTYMARRGLPDIEPQGTNYTEDDKLDDVIVSVNITTDDATSPSSLSLQPYINNATNYATKLGTWGKSVGSSLNLTFLYQQPWLYNFMWAFMIGMCVFLIVQLILVLNGQCKTIPLFRKSANDIKRRVLAWCIIITQILMSVFTLFTMWDGLKYEWRRQLYYPIFYLGQTYCAILLIMSISAFVMAASRRRIFAVDGLPAIIMISAPEILLCVLLNYMTAARGFLWSTVMFMFVMEYIFRHFFISAMYLYVYKSSEQADSAVYDGVQLISVRGAASGDETREVNRSEEYPLRD